MSRYHIIIFSFWRPNGHVQMSLFILRLKSANKIFALYYDSKLRYGSMKVDIVIYKQIMSEILDL